MYFVKRARSCERFKRVAKRYKKRYAKMKVQISYPLRLKLSSVNTKKDETNLVNKRQFINFKSLSWRIGAEGLESLTVGRIRDFGGVLRLFEGCPDVER